jgi:hypothetical protein
MIICNSNNFVVTRAPKTGGTSLSLYILQSGLVDSEKDEHTLEGDFDSWEKFKEFGESHNNLSYLEIPENLYNHMNLSEAQTPFSELVSQGRVSEKMPCVGSIRHPLEWLASLYYYANLRRTSTARKNLIEKGAYSERDLVMEINIKEPNRSFDFFFDDMWEHGVVQEVARPQSDYYPDHAKLFNTENIHEHVSEFILSKGGTVPERINFRKSDNDPTYYVQSLTADRKQRALDMYEKDLVLWEKARSVYA